MSQMAEEIRVQYGEMDKKRDEGLTTPSDILRFNDISYGSDPVWNKLDVYYKKGTSENLPVIVSVHGGGWVYGDKDVYQYYTMHLAQMGFTVVNFSYRLAPEHLYPAALEDVNSVFLWMERQAEQYRIDLQRVFIVGDSAGAQIASQYLAILTNEAYAELFGFSLPRKLRVRAAALNCGVYDVRKYVNETKNAPIKQYLPEEEQNAFHTADTIQAFTDRFPPAFIMTSHYDFLKQWAEPFYQLLRSKGVPCEYHLYGAPEKKEIGHVFHLNIRTEEAQLCNTEECRFFRKFL